MINSELLKEAIADAKAVRATALANAKAALEEAFAPRFEAMFAEKLKEESEEEEEGLSEEANPSSPPQITPKGGDAKGPGVKAIAKGKPKQPKGGSGDADFKAVQAGLGPTGVPKLGKNAAKVNETAEEEEEGKVEEQYEENEDNKTEEEGLTSEDLDEIIKELENEVSYEEEGKKEEPVIPAPKGNGEEGGFPQSPEGQFPQSPEGQFPQSTEGQFPQSTEGQFPQSTEDQEEFPQSPEDGREPLDINLGGEKGPSSGVNASQPKFNNTDEIPSDDVDGEMDGSDDRVDQRFPPSPEDNGEEEFPLLPDQQRGKQQFPPPQDNRDEQDEINIEELLQALNEESDEEEEGCKEEMDEDIGNECVGTSSPKKATKMGYPNRGPEKTKGTGQVKGKNHGGAIGTGGLGLSEVVKYKTALKESYATIEFLRGQINEVNLLNAKLLYTNKLFKEFAGILDDPYRMKIVESFDLTKNVREVKLAYALLAESLNFGTQIRRTSTKLATKPVPQKNSVRQITEGFASKPVSSTRPSQLITEGNEMALRFKKLAGIKDVPKIITEKK